MGRFKHFCRTSLLAGSRLDPRCIGPARADLARVLFFLGNALLILFDLQTLKLHRICSVHANEVVQISLGSLDVYLSDGIGLIILGAL
jgi:hypothetical protein